ncbi:putative sodium/hydrogen exchanger 3 (nhe3) [Schistosoma mansoni]|uniref:putative sodium/hydrogen exchanger 3 (nhe3) n=1 Tax=Schistosoma mansoni TaxID=6183 RepID=UPI0001A63790|nr:putative sodium/hydrogen exchanger 3 (nhe3) [Schistosoma mansoni]|eukprot:XP_018652694.1 putative sodium/hydrogen exchanger 3 (nhe3) [Schistosoma mansoni]
MADCVGWSGIISMIGCGLIQAAYAFHNLDRNSITMVRNLTKVVSEMSESVIFLFLGIEVVSIKLVWHTGYILWALIWCLISRAIVVFFITAIVNYTSFSNTKITITQQIVLIYGGLRGAVAFSLSVLILPTKLGIHGNYNRELIITTTLFIILFTVGFMGITMKPLVKLLKIRMENKQMLSLFDSLNDSIIDETLAGIECLIGSIGRNVIRDLIQRIDEQYLRKLLQRESNTYNQKIRLSTLTGDINNTPNVKQALRYSRRPSLVPKEKRQLDFDEALLDVMKSPYLNEEDEENYNEEDDDDIDRLKALIKAEQINDELKMKSKDNDDDNDEEKNEKDLEDDMNTEKSVKFIVNDSDDLNENIHRL